jgi:hypothetical protein
MKLNYETCIVGEKCILVPYREFFSLVRTNLTIVGKSWRLVDLVTYTASLLSF